MDDLDVDMRFPHMRPLKSPPALGSLFGFGTDLCGARDYDEDTNTCVKTRCLYLFGIPLLALGAYRVVDRPEGYLFLGREPLSGFARGLNFVVLCLALGLGSFGGWRYYTTTPEYLARQMLAEAEQHAAAGELVTAATLYGNVAKGTTSHGSQARQRFRELLAGPVRTARPEDALAILRIGAELRQRSQPPVSREEFFDSGMAVVNAQASGKPFVAFQVLEVIGSSAPDAGQLAPLRRQLLERAVAQEPADPDPASALAVVYEEQGDLAKCEALLLPHAARLGDREGARILGHVLAAQGKLEQAGELLQAYTESRLTRLRAAEQAFKEALTAAQDRLVTEVKDGKAPGFPYTRFNQANERERDTLWENYASPRLEADSQVKAAHEAFLRESSAVPAALDLGMVLLQHGRALPDPASRRTELEKAEKTFLAVRGLTGETNEYRMNLAQVYYWLGKPQQGRQLFDEVLKANRRQTMTVLQVARLLREVGDHSAARAMIEEAYGKESDTRLKYEAAAARAVIPLDLDDEITWLGRADPADSASRALLSSARGEKAIREGKDSEAVAHLRESIAAYDRQPESSATLNNSANACLFLFHLTGDRHDFDQRVSRLEKALARDPSHALVLGNTAGALLESGLWEAAEGLDCGALRRTGSISLLYFVCQDDAGRARLAQKVLANPKVARARAYLERLLVIAPKSAHGYASLAALLEFVGDRKGLTALRQQLEGAELDLEDQRRKAQEYYAGTKDAQQQQETRNEIKRYEGIVHALRGKQGPTFAAAAAALSAAWIRAEELGVPADADGILRLAEEAHAAYTSLATSGTLVEALSFRINRELARRDPAFQALLVRARRSTHPVLLLAAALAGNRNRTELVRANPDFQRLVRLVLERDVKSPEHPDPWSWVVLRSADPDRASKVAERIRADQVGELGRAIGLRISPLDASNALQSAWALEIAGKEADGRAILKRLSAQGVPLPVEVK